MSRAAEDFDPAYGRAVSVAPGLRRVTCRNGGHMTGPGTNTYIVGHGRVAIVDPGPTNAEHGAALLDSVCDETVDAVLVTHIHRDHSESAAALARRLDAPIVACDPALRRRVPGEGFGIDVDFSADRHLTDGEVVTLGEATLKAVFTPGHGSDHMSFEVESDGGPALLSGDHLMGWSTTVIAPPYGHMGDFLASVRRMLQMDEMPLYPGHGAPLTSPHPHMRALLNHRQGRESMILARVRDGRRTLPEITRASYPELDEAMLKVAQYSALAHLEHLTEQGLITVDDGASYVPA